MRERDYGKRLEKNLDVFLKSGGRVCSKILWVIQENHQDRAG
jgi:hypothetical protein